MKFIVTGGINLKRYGSFGKNFAALLLLIALISLLLPCCQINAGGQVTKLSGLDIVIWSG